VKQTTDDMQRFSPAHG